LSNRNINNYAKQALDAKRLFMQRDQSKIILRSGINLDEDYIRIVFFSNTYKVNRTDGEVTFDTDGKKADYNAVMVIYDLLCNSKANATLSGQWSLVENLSFHSNFGTKDENYYSPAAGHFTGQLDALKKACECLGGFATGKADAGYLFNAFSFMPMIFQFWEGDDEFSPRVSFLFDKNTLDYICFESAWFVAAHLVELILEQMGTEVNMGLYGR